MVFIENVNPQDISYGIRPPFLLFEFLCNKPLQDEQCTRTEQIAGARHANVLTKQKFV